MPDSEHLTRGARFAPSVPARQEVFPLKGCGAVDWGMQSRLARIFRPDTRRTVMLAIDHGYFQGPTTGLERVDLSILPLLPYADALMTTMGLGWDLALDMIDYGTADAASTLARARQQPRVLRTSRGSREVRLFAGDVTEFFDATVLEVADEIEVADGRFSIAIVTAGDGWAEGDFG